MKTVKNTNKTISFYIYTWNEEFTTFVVADSAQAALDIIESCKNIACPPELQQEKLSKKQLKKAEPNFILTINSPELTEDLAEPEEVKSSEALN